MPKKSRGGYIKVEIVKGNIYSTVVIKDDGKGMAEKDRKRDGLGSALVNMMIKEDLKGTWDMESGKNGTRVQFDFLMK